MQLNKYVSAIALAVSLGTFASNSSQAATYQDTGKGPRLVTLSKTANQTGHLTTLSDFKSLKKGDKMSVWCPMMKKTTLVTIRNMDSKGHAKITETREGLKMADCNVVLRRQADAKEVKSFMVCPDGTLTPSECHKV